MNTVVPNLFDAFWPRPAPLANATFRNFVLVVAGVCALTVSAKTQIPFYPVPMTLQTLVILVLGISYGMKLATATVLGYLVCGAVGLPVFAAGGGLAYFTGPTAGYLVGFLLAAMVMGYLGDRGWGQTARSMILPMTLGTVILFVPGVAWLAYLFGFETAMAKGLVIFIPSAVTKIVLAIPLVPSLWRLARKKD